MKKVEDVVVGTNSGMSAVFAEYYYFWEQKIFKALNDMVLKSMEALQSLFRESLLHKVLVYFSFTQFSTLSSMTNIINPLIRVIRSFDA